jgi:hypothetical protein
MNDTRTLPAIAISGVTLAAAAPALAIGAAIGLGLLWLFSDDEKPAVAASNAKTGEPGTTPPAPGTDTPRKSSGWFFDDEPEAAPVRSPLFSFGRDDAKEQDAIQRERAELEALKQSQREDTARLRALNAAAEARIRKHRDNEARLAGELNREQQRRITHRTVPAVRTVPSPALPRPVTELVVAPAATSQARPVTAQAAAPLDASRKIASVATKPAPGPFQLKARKYDRAHLEAVLRAGPLPRSAVVKALKAAPFNYGSTLAYATLQRFADALEQTPDGLLAWKSANGGN